VDGDIPQIAGFWRRIGAFALDGAVLGAFGLGLGLLWFDRLAALGGVGRLFGGGIALAYLTLLNSRIGRGQTLGKRALKIRVVDANGKAVGLSRAALRTFVLLLPITLNGAYVPAADGGSAMLVILSLCIFGLGGALVYLYLFNRRTRQSLHDLVARTFVVNAQGCGEIQERVWRPHLAIVLAWLLAIGVGAGPLATRLAGAGALQELTRLQRAAQAAAPGTQVAVQKGTQTFTSSSAGRSSAQFFRVRVVTSVKPASDEELADRVAAAVLSHAPAFEDIDQLVVSIDYGYDIMISNAHITSNFFHSPREWSERLKLDAGA
jgi:uncharacterized RDD family membrane protein YckC